MVQESAKEKCRWHRVQLSRGSIAQVAETERSNAARRTKVKPKDPWKCNRESMCRIHRHVTQRGMHKSKNV